MARSTKNTKARREAEAERRRTERRRRQLLKNSAMGIGVVGLLALLVFVVFDPQPPPTGTTAQSNWDLPQLDGDARVALGDFSGTPVVAAFFADWCPHCRRELPHYATVSRDLASEVTFVGINSQNSGQGLDFARDMGIDHWPLARDVGGRDGRGLSSAFGANGMPLTVFYDAAGTVAHVQIGPLTEDELRDTITNLFGISA